MKKILIIAIVLLLSSSVFAENEKTATSLLQDIEKFRQKEVQKNIDKYYTQVINELGILYGHYKIVRYKMSKKSMIENTFNRFTGLDKRDKSSRFFESALKSSSKLLVKAAWPLSYEVGGSIRKKQVKRMSNVLPGRYSPEDDCIKRLFLALDIAFFNQPDEFYHNAMQEISEIAERKFDLDKNW